MTATLLVTLSHHGRDLDLEIRIDGSAQVSDLVDALIDQASLDRLPPSPSLAVQRTGETLLCSTPLDEADLRSGDRLRLSDASRAPEPTPVTAAAIAEVIEGTDAGRRFELQPGYSDIGRGKVCDIQIRDEMASRRHARIYIDEHIQIADLNSTNGVQINGETCISVATVKPDDLVTIGNTTLRLRLLGTAETTAQNHVVKFNRPPRVFRAYEGAEIKLPAPPEDPPKQYLPRIAALIPLLMVGALWFFMEIVLKKEFPATLAIFMLLSPLMVVGSYFESKRSGRLSHKDRLAEHKKLLDRTIATLDALSAEEISSRCRESPSAEEVAEFAAHLSSRLWEHHADEEEFLTLSLGLAEQDSRTTVALDPGGSRRMRDDLEQIPPRYARIPDLPAIVSLPKIGGLGIAGPLQESYASARAVLAQLAGLHAPSDVVISALLGSTHAAEWRWLGWLPHVRSAVSPIGTSHFGTDARTCGQLLAELSAELDRRADDAQGRRAGGSVPLPVVVTLIDENAPLDRVRLAPLLESGPAAGLYFIWLGSARGRLPRACGAVLDLESRDGDVALGFRDSGEEIRNVSAEGLGKDAAEELARTLTPVVEVGGRVATGASVPQSVSLVELLGGVGIMDDPQTVVERWRHSEETVQRGGKLELRALIGRSAEGTITVDIRTDGPHALVAGTTGSGKSELLQTYVASLATTYSPQRVTFLLVDYKGGAAFKDCVHIPHTVGLVTDLNTSEVRRALISLEAELRYRETILNEAGAKDLIELESMDHPTTPPSLILIVDEFAALVKEVPEFVEGVVDVALRGRSLGIHLLLATQRPAGVVTAQIRANTNLRIALRVADDEDSVDVIGTKDAAALANDIPGRALAKLGPRDLSLFQSAYVGGVTRAEATGAVVAVAEFDFDRSRPMAAPVRRQQPRLTDEATDLHRLVDNMTAAAEKAGIDEPRRPWQPPLSAVYDLARLPRSTTDEEILIGVADVPRRQRQVLARFRPDQDGSILAMGASGSGKTVLLRTLAASAGLSRSGTTTHVYGLDFAGRGLEVLSDLPHVGTIVQGHDDQRVVRLLRDLRKLVSERSERFAAVRAGSLPEYRAAPRGRADESRILVLLDGYGAFYSAYERIDGGRWVDALTQLVGDGRQFGVHFVLTSDRRSAFPLALASAVPGRLVLRLASQDDYGGAGVPLDILTGSSPAGRAVFDGLETQIGLLGGDPSGDSQSNAMLELATYLRGRAHTPAPPVRILPELVDLSTVAPSPTGFAFGLRDDDLGPAVLEFSPGGFMVVGPPRSGKTTALDTLIAAAPPLVRGTVIVALHPSTLTEPRPGCQTAVGAEEGADLLRRVGENAERDLLVVVDDLHDFADSSVDTALSELLPSARSRGLMVVASASADGARRAYGGALRQIRGNKTGLLLQPDSDVDGDIVGIRLPRVANAVWPPGRAYLVTGGIYDLCQVATTS